MSTRSLICKELPDGQYYGVYCHSDGYLTYNGAMLIDHYSDREKLDELLSFGDMSRLNIKIHPDTSRPHSFDYDKQQEDVCVFYGRDRSETKTDARIITLEDAKNSWCEYLYVFGKDGVWRYYDLSLEDATCLSDVREDLDEEYNRMGIKRPVGYYGFWSPETIAQEKSYQEIVATYDCNLTPQENLANKVKKEIDEFKEKVLEKSPIEIYNEASKIHFYEYIGDFLQFEELDDKESKALFESSKHLISSLWDAMLELEDFNIGNVDDAHFLIAQYVSDNMEQM